MTNIRITLTFIFLLWLPLQGVADQLSLLEGKYTQVSLISEAGFASAAPLDIGQAPPAAPMNPLAFYKGLAPANGVDRIKGGSYWFYHRFKNISEVDEWVLEPVGSIIDTLHIYIYQKGVVKQVTTGYLHSFHHNSNYAIDFSLVKGEEAELLVFMQSRYFSGQPRLEVKSQQEFLSRWFVELSVVIACFGAIIVLACYNLFLGAWTKDRSYFYYSFYLAFSILAWLGAYNIFSSWLGWNSYWLLISPFFMVLACNTLYFIHFLDLPLTKPKLVKYLYGFVLFTFLMAVSLPLFSMGHYMLIYGASSTLWIVLALYCGIARLFEGYKPARFFIFAFTVLALGVLASLLPIIFPSIELNNDYLITLVTQTIDMLLLSLALADRINILRVDRENALNEAIQTEVWATEKEQEANVKLQQALTISEQESQRKSDFLRMVSHELRTPLYSILSSVEQWDDIDDEQGRRDLLQYMSYGAARLRMQVDNLVLLAETDDQDLEPTERVFQVRPLLEGLCENINGLLNESAEFEYICAEDVPGNFNGDSYLFEHMLRTVLENACKYTEHGKVGLYVQWENNTLNIRITDTGCGMTREQERTMFNDFVQVSRGLERNSEGLGIGLTVCYRLSEVLGADLNIQSTLGKGTHVIISVPFDVVDGVMGEVIESVGKIEKADILIVEDNLVNAQILQSLVSLMGGQTTIVDSGQAALTALEETSYDLVLMDIQMPVMDGVTATRWIRQRGNKVPIVAVTANSDADVRSRCIDVGMNDYLVKPVRRSDLQRVLERQLSLAKGYK